MENGLPFTGKLVSDLGSSSSRYPPNPQAQATSPHAAAMDVGGVAVLPGTKHRLEIPISRLPTQTMLSIPITVVNGARPGPRIWLSAAIHGDEINGIEIIRRVIGQIRPRYLNGSVIAVPIVNIFGFIEQSRYLPDRRDLNRSFPGSRRGSLASRIADLFMREVVTQCHYGIDLHTASHHRSNLPQIRADLHNPEAYRCAKAFGTSLIIHAATRDGSLREAAAKKGIPVLLYEAGEALRFDLDAIEIGVTGVLRVMKQLGMQNFSVTEPETPPLEISETKWVRSPRGGILHSLVELGDRVVKKQRMGTVTDAFGEKSIGIYSPCDGLVIGGTKNPLVNQGDGVWHLALFPTDTALAEG
jgi:predicted deacylase